MALEWPLISLNNGNETKVTPDIRDDNCTLRDVVITINVCFDSHVRDACEARSCWKGEVGMWAMLDLPRGTHEFQLFGGTLSKYARRRVKGNVTDKTLSRRIQGMAAPSCRQDRGDDYDQRPDPSLLALSGIPPDGGP